MSEFNLVNEAVKSFNSVEEYIKVGFDMTTEVAFDFIENGQSECVILILMINKYDNKIY